MAIASLASVITLFSCNSTKRLASDEYLLVKNEVIKEHPRDTDAKLNKKARLKFRQGRILKIPDTFDIHYFYRHNENPFLNRISTCYLTSMDIDYGGEKYVTYEPTKLESGQEGPPPQRTAITLAFTEIETITRERAEQGF